MFQGQVGILFASHLLSFLNITRNCFRFQMIQIDSEEFSGNFQNNAWRFSGMREDSVSGAAVRFGFGSD